MAILTETTLNRTLHHFQTQGYPAAIITAHRHEHTPEENRARNGQLIQMLRSAGYGGYIPIFGAWKSPEDGTETKEASYVIIGHQNAHLKEGAAVGQTTEDFKLLKVVTSIAVKFNQEGFVWKSSKPELMILSRNHEVIAGPFTKITLKELQVGYTRLRGRGGRVFAFEDAPYDSNWIMRMARIMNENQARPK